MNMNNKIKVLALALLVLLLGAAPAQAVDAFSPEIDIPTSVVVEASDDYAAGVFSQIFGPAWNFLAGPNGVFGGIGQYSGLLLAIFQVFNTVGMSAIALITLYQYGMGAVVTAHSGKVGGGVYNSFWTPLRSAIGLAFCTPVMHGLGLLQVLILSSIGLGINWGNIIWTEAATYVTEHVAAGATTDTQSQVIDAEAMEAIQPLFQGILLQEVFAKTAAAYGDEIPWSNVKEYHNPGPQSQWRMIWSEGPYIIEHRPREGEAILWLRPAKQADLGTFGGVRIPAPLAVFKNGQISMGDDPETYRAALQVTQIRLSALMDMADALRPWAKWHIAGPTERESGRVQRPAGDGFTIAEMYRKTVSDAMAGHIDDTGSGRKASAKLAEALGLTAPGQTPAGGWMGAGPLPTILSYASREADIVNYNGGVKPINVDATSGTYSADDGTLSRIVSWWRDELRIDDYHRGKLQTGPRFATQVLLAGRAWSGADEEGNAAGAVNQAITYIFTDGNLNNRGILAETMSDFQRKNPISALIDFGDRCLSVAALGMGVSAAAGLASAIPGIGGALAGLLNNNLFIAALGGIGLFGFLCMFVAPTTPVIVWARGILGWIIHALLGILGAPLLCIAMVFPEGVGFIGQHARKGYVQILDIAIRPAVMVACLCFATVLLQLWALILAAIFSKFANASTGYATTGLVWQIGMSIVYVSMVYGAVLLLFKQFVLQGPQTIMTWIGGIGMSLGSVEQSADRDTSGISGVAGKGMAASAGLGAGIGSAAQTLRDQKNKDKGGGNGGGSGGSKGITETPANMTEKDQDEKK